MADNEKKDPSEIKVEDRRRFAPDGSERSPSSEPSSSSTTSDATTPNPSASSSQGTDAATSKTSDSSSPSNATAPKTSASEPAGGGKTPPSSPKNHPLPKIDFSTLIFSFYHAALLHLGEMEEEDGQPPSSANLPMAKQSIDLLDILKAKTKGNLTKEEEALLDGFLFELRMKFLQRSKKS